MQATRLALVIAAVVKWGVAYAIASRTIDTRSEGCRYQRIDHVIYLEQGSFCEPFELFLDNGCYVHAFPRN